MYEGSGADIVLIHILGSASQSIKAIAFVIQERRYKTEKQTIQSQGN